mgnify:CR=1 FL=1
MGSRKYPNHFSNILVLKPPGKGHHDYRRRKAAYYLRETIIHMGVSVKIIEHDRARCEELSILLPKAIIIHGDGTNEDLLKEEGIEVVLVNSNPATIMTDKQIADKVYIEPLTTEVLKKIIKKEEPDSILPTLGGQAALNLAMELDESGFLVEIVSE